MINRIEDIECANLNYLKKLQTVEGDLEIAKRVVNNDTITVNYFLGEFSFPFFMCIFILYKFL